MKNEQLPAKRESDWRDPATMARDNVLQIQDLSISIVGQMLELGRLFYENRNGEYYKILGHDSWREFLGQPDIGYRESTVRGLMLIHKKYVLKMGVEKPLLSAIGFSKLRIVSPVVERDPAEWLAKAEMLSKTDLRIEVMEEQGKDAGSLQQPSESSSDSGSINPLMLSDYPQFVRQSPCCVCGARPPSERAHWPITKDPGDTPENEAWVIPLCVNCHTEYHTAGDVTFFKSYKRKIGRYFFHLLLSIYPKEEGNDQPNYEGAIIIEAETIPDRID